MQDLLTYLWLWDAVSATAQAPVTRDTETGKCVLEAQLVAEGVFTAMVTEYLASRPSREEALQW